MYDAARWRVALRGGVIRDAVCRRVAQRYVALQRVVVRDPHLIYAVLACVVAPYYMWMVRHGALRWAA